MTKIHRFVTITLCLSTPLVLSACDNSTGGSTAASVQPVSQQTPAEAPAKPAAPPTAEKAPAKGDPAVTPPEAKAHSHPVSTPVDPAAFIVKCDPPELDFGEIPTGDSSQRMVKLVNTSDKPMTIKTHRVTCGCTALELPANTVLGPHEVKEVKVQLNPNVTVGPMVGKKVTFVIEGQPDMELPLKATAVSFVMQEPAVITPEANPDGKLKLKSRDGKPFRIVSMQPPIVTEFAPEAAVEHEITINWEKYREHGILGKPMLFFDHPKCQSLQAKIEFSEEERRLAQDKWNRERAERQKEAIAAGNTPVVQPIDPTALLQQQIKEGRNEEVLKRIASGDLDVNTRDNQGVPVLSHTAKAGNVELLKALINAKADVEATDNAGRTPLMHAAMSKNVEAVRALLDAGASVSARDTIGGTALTWACGFGDAFSVKELLDAGSDVEVIGRVTGWTPVIWASGFGDPASIKPLIELGANVEVADQLEGATPLIHAARTGKVEGIRALIEAGAKLENKDYNGKTPLLSAAATSGGDATKVKTLIEAGANIHATDNRGYNALQLARKRTDPRAADVIAVLQPLLAAETPEDPNVPAKASAATEKPANAPAQATGAAAPAGETAPGANGAEGNHGG
jgi:ankyrin repeat protein